MGQTVALHVPTLSSIWRTKAFSTPLKGTSFSTVSQRILYPPPPSSSSSLQIFSPWIKSAVKTAPYALPGPVDAPWRGCHTQSAAVEKRYRQWGVTFGLSSCKGRVERNISVCLTHKNLAECEIMEEMAMRSVRKKRDSVSTRLKQHTRLKPWPNGPPNSSQVQNFDGFGYRLATHLAWVGSSWLDLDQAQIFTQLHFFYAYYTQKLR